MNIKEYLNTKNKYKITLAICVELPQNQDIGFSVWVSYHASISETQRD